MQAPVTKPRFWQTFWQPFLIDAQGPMHVGLRGEYNKYTINQYVLLLYIITQ